MVTSFIKTLLSSPNQTRVPEWKRYCKDCVHFDSKTLACKKILKTRDMVTGDLVYEFSRMARSFDGACGPTGTFWEPTLLFLVQLALFEKLPFLPQGADAPVEPTQTHYE